MSLFYFCDFIFLMAKLPCGQVVMQWKCGKMHAAKMCMPKVPIAKMLDTRVKHYFWGCLWRCFWKMWAFDSVAWVNRSAFTSVGGHHPICWRPKWKNNTTGQILSPSVLSWGIHLSYPWTSGLLVLRSSDSRTYTGSRLPQVLRTLDLD